MAICGQVLEELSISKQQAPHQLSLIKASRLSTLRCDTFHNPRFIASKSACKFHQNMPLVKIFARSGMTKPIPLSSLQSKLCGIWGTKPNTTKLMLFRCEDWTDESFQEDCYGK